MSEIEQFRSMFNNAREIFENTPDNWCNWGLSGSINKMPILNAIAAVQYSGGTRGVLYGVGLFVRPEIALEYYSIIKQLTIPMPAKNAEEALAMQWRDMHGFVWPLMYHQRAKPQVMQATAQQNLPYGFISIGTGESGIITVHVFHPPELFTSDVLADIQRGAVSATVHNN